MKKTIFLGVIILLILAISYKMGWISTGSLNAFSNTPATWQDQSTIQKDPATENASLTIDGDAIEIDLKSTPINNLVEAHLTSNLGNLVSQTKNIGSHQDIGLSIKNVKPLQFSNVINKLNVSVNPSTYFQQLSINADASEANLDTSSLKVEELHLNASAGDFKLNLGSLLEKSKVYIKAGAGNISVTVPKDVGVKVHNDNSFMNSVIIDGKKQSESENSSYATKSVDIYLDAGASSLKVIRAS